MERENRDLLIIILQRLGLNINGSKSGNGLINEVDEIQNLVDDVRMEVKDLKNKVYLLEKNIDSLNKNIDTILEAVEKLEEQTRNNISFQTFISAKNIIIGIASVIGAFGVIGTMMYKFLSKLLGE